MTDPFELNLDGVDRLDEEERLQLLRLLASGQITEDQAREALAIQKQHQSSLLSILLARRYITQREYATHLAGLTETAYASDAVGSLEMEPDEKYVRLYNPAELVRFLVCPLHQVGDMVVVLAVEPNDPRVTTVVHRVSPGTEVVALAATEMDITRIVDRLFGAAMLEKAVNELHAKRPDLSALTVFTKMQIVALFLALSAILAGFVFAFWWTAELLLLSLGVLYAVLVGSRLLIGTVGAIAGPREVSSKPGGPASAAHDDDLDPTTLPIYSVLVPIYKEPEVIPTLLAALERLDYPPEKLDVLILLEEDDTQTIARAKAAKPPGFFRFIYIPQSMPKTKLKACNYGLNFCRGEFVTIYDAEDIPDPKQLKTAVRAFRRGDNNLVCVRAALNCFNHSETWLTRMVTLEYGFRFGYLLPGLVRLGLPVPIGGSSSHFRVRRLRAMGAWDPFNVTEDADLGVRASCEGQTVGVIGSTTYEEANRSVLNWIRQRSRWIKGYMQTWLVHNRQPRHLIGQMGLKRWLGFQLLVGGACFILLANPLLWIACIQWLMAQPAWSDPRFGMDGMDVARLALGGFLVANVIGIVQGVAAALRQRRFGLALFALTTPIYWLLQSIAAYVAVWQLFTNPFYWEKTAHGLTRVNALELMKEGGALGA